MVKVTQNLWKESVDNIFGPDSLRSLWLWGSNSCLLSSQAGFKSCRRKGFFQIGMIIKLSLGSTYPNTVLNKPIYIKMSELCLSVCFSVRLFFCPSVCPLKKYLSVGLSTFKICVCPFVHQKILPTYLSVHLYQRVCQPEASRWLK